ncbi:MAG: HD domain-containing protein [Gemmatales bacterium]|nr:HD domain-containing protein [Gemmatales bacterium]MDW8385412.1 HD domain-containing phosphohydrolase [Gemmatales bacterium]
MDAQGGLAERVAALRRRLEELAPLSPQADPSPDLARIRHLHEQIQQLRQQNDLLESRLARLSDEQLPPSSAPPTRLASRTRELLLRGKHLLDALKSLSVELPSESENRQEEVWWDYQQTVQLVEIALRSVQTFPTATADQLRLCGGLELCLDLAEQRLTVLRTRLDQHRTAQEMLDALSHYFAELIHGRHLLLKPLQDLAERIAHDCQADQPFHWFSGSTEEPARWSAAHGLNTAQIMARTARLDPQWRTGIVEAVLSALLHDVGMAAMPSELIGAKRPFSEEDRRQIEAHVGIGAEIARRLAPQDSWLAEAILAHHERLDGTGYPAGLRGHHIPRLARLLAVCDLYAALIRSRPHRPAVPPRTALAETLTEAEKGRLDTELAAYLLGISFYPVGTLVELSDGRIGSVVAVHQQPMDLATASRPVVRILMDAQGQPVPLPSYVNLAQCDGLYIVRGLTEDETRRALRVRTWNA